MAFFCHFFKVAFFCHFKMAFFWQNQGTSDRIMVPKAHIAAHARASKAHRATTRAGRHPSHVPLGPTRAFGVWAHPDQGQRQVCSYLAWWI